MAPGPAAILGSPSTVIRTDHSDRAKTRVSGAGSFVPGATPSAPPKTDARGVSTRPASGARSLSPTTATAGGGSGGPGGTSHGRARFVPEARIDLDDDPPGLLGMEIGDPPLRVGLGARDERVARGLGAGPGLGEARNLEGHVVNPRPGASPDPMAEAVGPARRAIAARPPPRL